MFRFDIFVKIKSSMKNGWSRRENDIMFTCFLFSTTRKLTEGENLILPRKIQHPPPLHHSLANCMKQVIHYSQPELNPLQNK